MQDIEELYKIILKRKDKRKKGSYTNYLFDEGLDKILKKVGEESTEVIVAAKNSSKKDFVYETADLVYHLLVLMAEKNVSVEQLKKELGKRKGLMSKFKDRRQITNL